MQLGEQENWVHNTLKTVTQHFERDRIYHTLKAVTQHTFKGCLILKNTIPTSFFARNPTVISTGSKRGESVFLFSTEQKMSGWVVVQPTQLL